MKISSIVIDTSDTTVVKSKKYLKHLAFIVWQTGSPLRLCQYSIAGEDNSHIAINFRDKKEVKKFAKWINHVVKLL